MGGKIFADDENVEMELWKWLRQQSKGFLCCRFRCTGKAMGQVSVEGIPRNESFHRVRISNSLRFISICDLFTDSPSCSVISLSFKTNNETYLQDRPRPLFLVLFVIYYLLVVLNFDAI
jgi:hypothetical protein